MLYTPPHCKTYNLDTLFLDLNGTVAVSGKVVSGVKSRLLQLKKLGYKITLLSGDHNGTAASIAHTLQIDYVKATDSTEKARVVSKNNKESTVSIGNARIDIGMFKHSQLAIATVQAEGIHAAVTKYVDIIVPSITAALDLLIHRNQFEATMRL